MRKSCFLLVNTTEATSQATTGVGSVDVRLIGGAHGLSGRVEVLYNGTWGTICNSTFNNTNAKVVCHMLGYR